jgi:hypothetical protein
MIAIAIALLVTPMSLPATAEEDYPTWSDVEAARGSAAATEAQVSRINLLLAGLETRAAQLGDAAITTSADAATAQVDWERASARTADLATQLTDAGEDSAAATVQLGRLAAQLYQSGAGELVYRMLLTHDPDTDLLYQLSVSTRLSESTRAVEEKAVAQRNLVSALEEQASLAARERDRLASESRRKADAAAAAQRAADEEVLAQRSTADVLVAQLASLKNSTAEIERGYRAGVAAAEAYRQQQEEAARAAAAAAAARPAGPPASPPGSGGGGSGSAPPPGLVADPAGAKAYAAGAVAARGWGNDQYNCLVLLWNRESGWRVNAYNASSGAYGIPQALPGSKMASAGDDWRTNAETQVDWGVGYIADRYGTPCAAWAHSEAFNWY